MAKLLIKDSGSAVRELELKPGLNRFGRGAGNDHVFDDHEISTHHCEILVENDLVFVRDLNSTNGIFIDGDPVRESALYSGQTLRLGGVEMLLDAPARVAIPELPGPEATGPAAPALLNDGYPACLNHFTRHAIWECPQCRQLYCDECIRKLRRVGGAYLKLCAKCSQPCRYTAWSEMMRKRKKGFFGKLISKITDGIKRTTKQISR